jgi:SAM-dependent methyltransferase
VDVGCGTGIWLAALREKGVADVFGVDGPWVPKELLAVPETMFLEYDLTEPLALDRRFDLALCLEAAEHLPTEAAAVLVDSLVRLAPIVVFSAAVPGQGGHGHLNEQWPGYWKDLFAVHGYQCSTALRNRLWHSEEIESWYRQNFLCFADAPHALRLAPLFAEAADDAPLDTVHPDVLRSVREELNAKAADAERLEREEVELKAAVQRLEGAFHDAQMARDKARAELKPVRLRLQTVEEALRSSEKELCATRNELHRIRESRPYRLYRRVRAPVVAGRRSLAALWPRGGSRA